MPDAKTDQRTPPRFDELLARAEGMIPTLRERAPRAEQLRRLPDETIAAVREVAERGARAHAAADREHDPAVG